MKGLAMVLRNLLSGKDLGNEPHSSLWPGDECGKTRLYLIHVDFWHFGGNTISTADIAFRNPLSHRGFSVSHLSEGIENSRGQRQPHFGGVTFLRGGRGDRSLQLAGGLGRLARWRAGWVSVVMAHLALKLNLERLPALVREVVKLAGDLFIGARGRCRLCA
jgi:hypothetical protein